MFRHRWFALVAVLLFLVLLRGVDAWLKGSEVTGYAPAGSTLVVSSSSVPAVWKSFEGSAIHDRIMAESPQWFYSLRLEARKATGVNWTPGSWNLWFGTRAVMAEAETGRGLCVKPGVLLRVAFGAANFLGSERDALGVRAWQGIAYGWREGFLVLSTSPAFVAAALLKDAEAVTLDEGAGALRVSWRGASEGWASIRPGSPMTVSGWIDREVSDATVALTLTEAMPRGALLSVSGAVPAEFLESARDFLPEFPGLELVEDAFDDLESQLPESWADGLVEYSFALAGVDTREFLAVPEMAMVGRGDSSLAALRMPRNGVPYLWAGSSGWMRPWLGEKLSVCVAGQGGTRWYASHERLMARIVESPRDGNEVKADIVVAADVGALARLAEELYGRAAEHELLERMNAEDVAREIVPITQALAQVGRIELRGDVANGGVGFEGSIALSGTETTR